MKIAALLFWFWRTGALCSCVAADLAERLSYRKIKRSPAAHGRGLKQLGGQ